MRQILLDTHIWLWLQTDRSRFSERVLSELKDRENGVFLSAASSWEISIKYGLGKLPLPEIPERYVPDRLARSGVVGLAVDHSHALRVAGLPNHHRDPFDRLLIAQAQIEGLELMTVDATMSLYDVPISQPDDQ